MVQPQTNGGLFRMLSDLASDERLLAEFTDPKIQREVMDRYGLDSKQIELLEKSMDETRDELLRYADVARLIVDEARMKLIPIC